MCIKAVYFHCDCYTYIRLVLFYNKKLLDVYAVDFLNGPQLIFTFNI